MKYKVFFTLLALALAIPQPSLLVRAHAIDSANVDQYTRLEPGLTSIQVHYVIDMGNLPAYLERRVIDANTDAEVSSEEQEAYLQRIVPQLLAGISLTVNGNPVELHLKTKDLSFPIIEVPDVDGGLLTMRLVLDLEAQLPETSSSSFEYHNNNFPEMNGWREIVVRPSDGLTIDDPTLAEDLSNELQAYPPGMPSLLDVRSVNFHLTPEDGAAQPAATSQPGVQRTPQPDDRFAALIAVPELTPPVILFSLILSLALGAGHALTPGHGKAIVGAYLVGNRGRAKDAVILGLTTTLTHTVGVFALGFATMLLSNYILPEKLFPWLELLSGVLVVVIGASMFWQRLADLMRYGYVPAHSQTEHSHDHSHDDEHHHHDHHDHGPHSHTHLPADPDQPVTLRGLLALGISGGLVPCPSALVVMLGAIALHRVAFGMFLIVAFSVGLAGVLTGIGLLLVYARRFFERIPTDGRWIRAISVVSAGIVTLAGLVLSASALAQLGFFG